MRDIGSDRLAGDFIQGLRRDPELTLRSNRRTYVLPPQIAMYIARQLTGASLQEIGHQFGGRHHATVRHSINKIEAMLRSDEALNRTITQLIDTFRPCVRLARTLREVHI